MPGAGPDLLEASGTEVGLAGLERVNLPDLHGTGQRGINAHNRKAAITTNAAATIT